MTATPLPGNVGRTDPTRRDEPAVQVNARRAATASFVGGTLEYYDFFLYGSASALVFNKVFFPGIDPYLGQILAMATIGIGYVVRPVAAAVIGHYGDRIGRKQMLLLTLILMGTATTLIGALPTTAQIGALAPILLVLLRVLQGISAAGESVGAATLSLEAAPDHKRAFYTSWVNTGSVAGIMLASLAFLVVSFLPEQALLTWGWRVPFLASVIVVAIGLWIRLKLVESEVFKDAKEHVEHSELRNELPIVTVFKRHPLTLLTVVGIQLFAVVSSVFSAFGLSYGANTLKVPGAVMLSLTIVTAALGIGFQPLAGVLADRVGRKPVFVVGNVLCAIAVFAYFWSLTTGVVPLMFLTSILFMTIAYGLVNPLAPLMIAELFETEIRYSGAAFGSQLGLIVTGFAPAIAAAVVQPGPTGWVPVAALTAACSLISALVVLFAVRETYRTATKDLARASAVTVPA
ncbi:MAG: MFS transporter [Dermatophilaceae bacterium]